MQERRAEQLVYMINLDAAVHKTSYVDVNVNVENYWKSLQVKKKVLNEMDSKKTHTKHIFGTTTNKRWKS